MEYELIDTLLREKGMSRRKLAEAAGISENTLSAAFRRKSKNVSIEVVQKIADVLGVNWWELKGWQDFGGGVYGHAETSPEKLKAFSKRLFGKEALQISEAELMGAGQLIPVDLGDGKTASFYNPPANDPAHVYVDDDVPAMREELLDYFDNQLNIGGKRKVLEAARDYAGNQKYCKG